MDRAELLAELQKVLRETVFDAAWGDTTLTRYLAEGQDVFCEKTGFFREFGNALDNITLVEDQQVYAIPRVDRIISVLGIWNKTTRLGKFQETDRPVQSLPDWNPGQVVPREGVPTSWQTDRTTGQITFNSIPKAIDAGTVLTGFVWRYSTTDYNTALTAPELPQRFRFAMVEWACWKALSHHDKEQQDKIKAQDHKDNFDEYVRDGKRYMRRFQGIESRVGTSPAYRT